MPATVGREVVVTATRAAAPAVGIEVTLEGTDGTRVVVGVTDVRGEVRHRVSAVGDFTFTATIDGVRCLAPTPFVPARDRWWLAVGSVPLGLALLWIHLRRIWVRARAGQASTRST